jgi:hypothetical protein
MALWNTVRGESVPSERHQQLTFSLVELLCLGLGVHPDVHPGEEEPPQHTESERVDVER